VFLDLADLVNIASPVVYEVATEDGVRTLWAVFGIMVFASAAFAYLAHRTPVSNRLYHVVTTLITVIAALSYFAMASGSGSSFVCVNMPDHHDNVPDTSHLTCRQTFWARYVDWSLTTPLLLLDLSLLAGLDGAHTLIAIASDLVMILGGLFAAYGGRNDTRRWGWYAIAWIAFLTVVWHVGYRGGRAARAKGDQAAKVFAGLAPFTFVLWVAYPA
jgi:bacteriorhodopsin